MATLLHRPSTVTRSSIDPAPRAPMDRLVPAGRRLDEMTDREAGLVAVGVIAALGLLLAAILTAILIYSFGWGYAIQL